MSAVFLPICKVFPSVKYYFQDKPQPRNALAVLMVSQREMKLPAKIEGERLRGDQRLRNSLIEVLAAMNVGWTRDIVGTAGEKCIKVLSASLWYIDPCRH